MPPYKPTNATFFAQQFKHCMSPTKIFTYQIATELLMQISFICCILCFRGSSLHLRLILPYPVTGVTHEPEK